MARREQDRLLGIEIQRGILMIAEAPVRLIQLVGRDPQIDEPAREHGALGQESGDIMKIAVERMERAVSREPFGGETDRFLMDVNGPVRGISIPLYQWHTVEVTEPCVILEAKDGPYEPARPENLKV